MTPKSKLPAPHLLLAMAAPCAATAHCTSEPSTPSNLICIRGRYALRRQGNPMPCRFPSPLSREPLLCIDVFPSSNRRPLPPPQLSLLCCTFSCAEAASLPALRAALAGVAPASSRFPGRDWIPACRSSPWPLVSCSLQPIRHALALACAHTYSEHHHIVGCHTLLAARHCTPRPCPADPHALPTRANGEQPPATHVDALLPLPCPA
jgi:hypothetical protein